MLPSDHRPQFSQPPQPGTSFGVPQRNDDTSSRWRKSSTSIKDPRDLAPPGAIRLRHKFRCQKPYEDKTFKVPGSRTADRLWSPTALRKKTSSKKTLDPKDNNGGKVLLLMKAAEGRSNPPSRKPRPSASQPATKRTVTTVSEEPMDTGQPDTKVTQCNQGVTNHSRGRSPTVSTGSEELMDTDQPDTAEATDTHIHSHAVSEGSRCKNGADSAQDIDILNYEEELEIQGKLKAQIPRHWRTSDINLVKEVGYIRLSLNKKRTFDTLVSLHGN
ncbi:hypothetical protein STEG23_026700 [Scotinomys teguina]